MSYVDPIADNIAKLFRDAKGYASFNTARAKLLKFQAIADANVMPGSKPYMRIGRRTIDGRYLIIADHNACDIDCWFVMKCCMNNICVHKDGAH